jgi:hypothetical protein
MGFRDCTNTPPTVKPAAFVDGCRCRNATSSGNSTNPYKRYRPALDRLPKVEILLDNPRDQTLKGEGRTYKVLGAYHRCKRSLEQRLLFLESPFLEGSIEFGSHLIESLTKS